MRYARPISRSSRPVRGTYDVLWKVPGRGDVLRLGLYVALPTHCGTIGPVRSSFVNNAFTERWR